MKISSMTCNHLENPLGYTMEQLVFGWKTESDTADYQTAARVEIALDASFSKPLLDTGRRENLDSIAWSPDPALNFEATLKPRTRYYWRVTVWSDDGLQAVSEPGWFETGKMGEPFAAEWIGAGEKDGHALLRSEFSVSLDKAIASARLYASAAGLYEAEINGVKAGNELLAPYCNKYSAWMQYQTYDVTSLLQPGVNAIGVLLGDGWYRGKFGFDGGAACIFGERQGFIGELIITYTDGSVQVIVSDASWKSTSSFITFSSIYDGEFQDMNRLIPGWSQAGLEHADDAGIWHAVDILNIDKSLLMARLSIPVVVKETISSIAVITTPAGETVLDMGQNMVGYLAFEADFIKGTEVFFQFGEILQNGNFYRDNLREARQEFKYLSDGVKRTVRPYFTYYGFRFVKVTGWPGEVKPEMFEGCVVYSDMKRTGWLETSNAKVNQLISNAVWGQKGNFLDVPTDCPQRDERMGWTGDAQVFCATASFNMDTYAFYRKYLYDMQREQADNRGMVPVVVPNMIKGERFMQSSAWADATTIIPWTSYLFSGDKSILKEHFPSMKAYVESIRRDDDGSRLWKPHFSFGDWLAQDGPSPYAPIGGTDIHLISTAYWHYSTLLTAKAAEVIGLDDEAAEYYELAGEIRDAYREEFLSKRGRMAVDTQTAAVVTLFMDLMSDDHRTRVADRLHALLKQNNFYLKTGFVGTPYLCRALSENGYNDDAYKLLLNENFPSWLYCVNLGATTIWERWNSVMANGLIGDTGMNSLNHYAYGSICEWMYRNMCGINPMAEAPGFRRVRITPQPNGRIRWAKAKIDSPVGVYESGWEILEDGKLRVTVTVPFGGIAEVILPDSGLETRVLARGTHVFEYQPTKEYRFRYSTWNTTVGEMMMNPKVVEVIEGIRPGTMSVVGSVMGENMRPSTFRELLGGFGFRCEPELLDRMDEALGGIAYGA